MNTLLEANGPVTPTGGRRHVQVHCDIAHAYGSSCGFVAEA